MAARENTGPRFALVCSLILALMLVAIAAPEGDAGRSATTILSGIALIGAVWASRVTHRFLTIAGSTVVVVVLAAVLWNALGHGGTTANAVVATLLITAIPVAIVVGLRDERTVNMQTVFGALSLYLLIGMFFAFLITAVTSVSDTEYFAQGTDGTISKRMYFSYITLATVGYGDLTPATSFGRALSVLEAILGSLYLVTVVSVVVSRLGRERPRGDVAAR